MKVRGFVNGRRKRVPNGNALGTFCNWHVGPDVGHSLTIDLSTFSGRVEDLF